MTADYELRLLLQCLTCFFIVHLLVSAAVALYVPLNNLCAERMRAKAGARLLFTVRVVPLSASILATMAVALPSYIRLEPESVNERIGVGAAACALFAIGVWIRPLVRTIRALNHSRHFKNAVLTGDQPNIVVSGVLRPRVLLSPSIADFLTPNELRLALRHERVHLVSHDNLKRLILLMLPDPLPFINFGRNLDGAWKRIAEWAADDYAVVTEVRDRLVLASLLVRFARLQNRAATVSVLSTSLLEDHSQLEQRVRRLLAGPRAPEPFGISQLVVSLSLALAAAAVLGMAHFANLPEAHRLLELLSR